MYFGITCAWKKKITGNNIEALVGEIVDWEIANQEIGLAHM